LSINNKTSLHSSSLKYSAIVSAVNATLALGPGGSFICQYTIAVLSITHDSDISKYKSLPSLVLSPTHATTETPECSEAIL